MGKPSKTELEGRLRSLRRALLLGQQYEDMIAAARQNWGIKRQTVMRYLKLLFAEWRNRPGTRGDFRRLGIEQRDELYRRGLAKDRLREALASLDSRDKLRGLFDRRPKRGGGARTLAEWIRASLKESEELERAEVSEVGTSGEWGSGHEEAGE